MPGKILIIVSPLDEINALTRRANRDELTQEIDTLTHTAHAELAVKREKTFALPMAFTVTARIFIGTITTPL